IRDRTVTGVQTCALPISDPRAVGRKAVRCGAKGDQRKTNRRCSRSDEGACAGGAAGHSFEARRSMKGRVQSLKPWIGAFALLALALAIFFRRAIFGGKVFFLGDITFFYYPVFAYATASLRAGTIPLW